ncbi:Na+/phosphate symporter [Anaerosolibacter carboniphilus]|uniref:Na+/phosphate symporter n=1 Tax=Anaerosolibacter carboniphilus TaxID=1417629 RepID=A0A841KZH4_9FIRM|nr:hypothetical protein [Anaerosolibacter carboniphilus]MBB6215539.1 Na+/phosphate symporter [Anaerosolibacter carboniphilus]
MEDENGKILRISSVEEYHKKWMEELDFILDAMHRMSAEDRAAVKTYMSRTIEFVEEEEEIDQNAYAQYRDLEAYEEKIKETKQEIKYLKKLRKKKEELEEKKMKRYKILRKLYKEDRLDPALEDEYRELREEFKYKKSHD